MFCVMACFMFCLTSICKILYASMLNNKCSVGRNVQSHVDLYWSLLGWQDMLIIMVNVQSHVDLYWSLLGLLIVCRQVTGSMKPCRVQASHEKSEAMSCAEVMRSMKPCSAAAEKSRAARSHKSLCVVIVHWSHEPLLFCEVTILCYFVSRVYVYYF